MSAKKIGGWFRGTVVRHRSRSFALAGFMLTISVMGVATFAVELSCKPPPVHDEFWPESYADMIDAVVPPRINDQDAVFFVGNSFFAWDSRILPDWIEALGRSLEPPVHISVNSDIVPGDRPLSFFLDHEPTRSALSSGRYKAFVLVADESEPVDRKDEFDRAVRDFVARAHSSGARVILFMSWEFPWRRFLDELAASYDEIGQELDVDVVPAGLMYRRADLAPFSDRRAFWLTATPDAPGGALHQNAFGSALNAYATVAMLTGRNPHGAAIDAPGSAATPDLAQYLSRLAWSGVAPRILKRGCPARDMQC